jgi:chemotaxis protein methyltransferase CheR
MVLPMLSEPTCARLVELMQATLGLGLAAARPAWIAARLAPRLQRLGLASYEAYVALIGAADGRAEFALAVDLLTTPEAWFFRDAAQFERLEAELSMSRPQRPRLWSAAASAGHEAYSLAMVLADLQQAGRISADWRVLGTDISERRLRSAAEAVFPEAQLRQVTPERLRRYAAASHGLVQMQAGLREHVHFERHDLRAPLHGAQGFDAIWLRQVLAYFDAGTRQAVLALVLARLHAGGLLVVGTNEAALAATPGLAPLGDGVFRKI